MDNEINKLMVKEEVPQYVYVLIDNNTSEVWGIYSSIGGAFEEFYNTIMRWSVDKYIEYDMDMDIDNGYVAIGTDLAHEGPDFIIQKKELKK